MKRKIYLFFTALLMMATTSAWADDVYTGNDGLKYTISNNEAQLAVQKNLADRDTLTIPSEVTINGASYKVTSIATDAFNSGGFSSIVFKEPTNITSIPDWAFGNCSKVAEIKIPEGITRIGGCAFTWMSELEKIEFPSSVTWVGDYSFQGAKNVKTIIFDGSNPPSTFGTTARLAFNEVDLSSITIVVPDNALDAYTTKFQKGGFKQIITQTTYEKTPCSITWNFVDKDGNTTATETKDNCYSGTKYTPSCSVVYGLELDDNATVTATGNDITVNVTYTFDDSKWPFKLSTSYDNATWYQVKIRDAGKYCQYDGSTITNSSTDSSTEPSSLTRKDLFAFVGTPFGFRIYNARAGADKPFGPSTCSDGTLLTSGSYDNAAVLFFLKGKNGSYNVFRYRDYNLGYLNDYYGHLGVWYAEGALNDGGSNLTFIEIGENEAKNILDNEIYIDDIEIDGLYYNLSKQGNTATAYLTESNQNCKKTNVVVPDSVSYNGNVFTVAGLIGQTFRKNTTIKTLEFQSKTLDYSQGTQMFEKMSNLTSLILQPPTENTKTELDTWVMNECTSLASIEILEGFTKLNDVDTKDLTSLTTITLPSTLNSIGARCFTGTTFSDANKNYYVNINAENAPTISSNGNDNIKNAIVIVPSATAKTNYENAEIWKTAKAIITQAEYDALKAKTPNYPVYVLSTSTLKGDNIVRGGTCDNLVLTDGYSFAPSKDFTANKATYTRSMTNTWGTIMLPYEVKSNDNVAFYSIGSVSVDGVLTVTKAETLTAGTPALFKTNGASSVTFSASSANVVTTKQTASGGGLTLVGTYTRDTIDVEGTYYIKNDKFYSKGDGISFIVNPFRAYIKSDGSTNSNAFSIAVDDDPTGITAAATSAGVSDEIEGVYSISGVKLSDLQKGINIVRYRSGKTQKVILK